MRSYSSTLVSIVALANLVSATQLRADYTSLTSSLEMVLERLGALEVQVEKQQATIAAHEATISGLEEAVHEHVQTITDLQQRRLQETDPCAMEMMSGYCMLSGDLLVTGMATISEGLMVMATGCDDCIKFHDDVTFGDMVTFTEPVVFESPASFQSDVSIAGGDEKNPMEFSVSGHSSIMFDTEEAFTVKSETTFTKDVDLEKDDSKDDPPNLTVEGNIEAEGTVSELVED